MTFNPALFAVFTPNGRVPPVPQAEKLRGTGRGTQEDVSEQTLSNLVPPVPHAPHANSDAGDEERLCDLYEERAAIMEYDGGMSREDAERTAWADVYGYRPRPEKA